MSPAPKTLNQATPPPLSTPMPLRHHAAVVQRKCACGGAPGAAGECAECGKKKLQRKTWNSEPGPRNESSVPAIVHEVLRSAGQPLDPATRAFMEPRFGHDFSAVRVHADAQAAESARAVNALAYTVNRNIVFGAGQFAPHTACGRRLMAHELTHSLQQRGENDQQIQGKLRVGPAKDCYEQEADHVADAVIENRRPTVNSISAFSGVVQRACGPAEINEPQGCTFDSSEVSRPRYLFRVNCDEFARGNEKDLRADAATIVQGEIIEIHGLASHEGSPEFNLNLSCARALRAKAVIADVLAARGITATFRIFHHGAVPGDAVQQRSVVLVRTAAPPSEPLRQCGPDVTAWFISIMNSAKTNGTVRAIQQNMAGASRVGARHGYSSTDVLEGGLARRIRVAEAAAGSPTRTADARSQLSQADPQNQFGRALTAATAPILFAGAPEQMMFLALRRSGEAWKSLVQTNAVWDFKNNVLSGASLAAADCQNPCIAPPTVTLCGTCFEHDLPGNLFYAYIGRFCGFSLNALQLGSQFAELQPNSSSNWDTPEDTAAIALGFGLPATLTEANLCNALRGASGLTIRPCPVCSAVYP